MDLFWIIIFIGYFLFRALGKKLPEMMEEFPGEWKLPGNQQETDGQDIGRTGTAGTGVPGEARETKRLRQPHRPAGAGEKEGGADSRRKQREDVPRRTGEHMEVLPPLTEPEDGPAAIDYRDVVNGIIMSEVLQPPLARRKKR